MLRYSTQLINSDDEQAVLTALRSGFITRGPVTRQLEDKLAEVVGKKYCVSCSNGTVALWMALEASREQHIHTPTLTYSAVVNAAEYSTSKPIVGFYDSDEDTLCHHWGDGLDGALVAMDYAGYPSLERKPKFDFAGTVILDAAHSLGATLDNGTSNATHADIVTLSLHALKLVTAAEGGAVLTDNEYIYKELLLLRNNGIDSTGLKVGYGLNCHMDELSAALALSQLGRLKQSIERRHEIANFYYQAWNEDLRIILPAWARGHAYHLFALRFTERVKATTDTIKKELAELGVGTQTHYRPIHLQPAYQHLNLKGVYPIAERAFERLVSIPMYMGLSDKEVGTVIHAVNQVMEKYS